MASKQPSTQIKVCLVAISLGRGGAERSTALLSQMLAEKGFNVTIVILNNLVDYPYKGDLVNLGKLKTKEDTIIKRLIRFNKLKQFLKKEKFDFILDNRTRSNGAEELFYLKHIYANQRVLYVVRSFNLLQYFPKEKWITKKMINNSELIIGVSKAISEKINAEYKTNKTKTIYNPVEPLSETENKNPPNEKYILYLGRIEEKVKNFTLLLNG
ncbi:MAG TPA: glycosyltransferase, partial [Flavobacteriaceae bacterium]|nr:glycosyltransferase [Flavobacteriaceae bacterium]